MSCTNGCRWTNRGFAGAELFQFDAFADDIFTLGTTRHDTTRHDEKRAKVFDCIQKLPNFFFSFEQVEANRNKLRWNIKIEWKIVHSYSTVMPSRISKLKYILDWNSISFLIGRSCVECFEANTKVVCTNITNAT